MPDPSSPMHADSAARGRAVLLCAVLVMSFGMTSCNAVEFIHPLATPADTLWRSVWTGTWTDTTEAEDTDWIDFNTPSGARWFLRGTDGAWEIEIRPVLIEQRWYADLHLVSLKREGRDVDSLGDESLAEAKRYFSIARLDLVAEGLNFSMLLDDDLERFRGEHPGVLPKTTPSSDAHYRLTSSSAEIRDFLARYGSADSLFDLGGTYIRQR